MMTFRPELNQIDIITYSPTAVNSTRDPDHDGFEETAAGQFTPAVQHVGQRLDADRDRDQRGLRRSRHGASGTGLQTGTSYEWYAVANDGIFSTQGPTSVFSTGGTPNQAPVIDSVTMNQSSPKTNDTLSATVTSHDPEGSPVTYSYQWLKGGVAISGATNAHAEPVGSEQREQGRSRSACAFVGSDGSLSAARSRSSSVTVANTAPTATVSSEQEQPAGQRDADGDGHPGRHRRRHGLADVHVEGERRDPQDHGQHLLTHGHVRHVAGQQRQPGRHDHARRDAERRDGQRHGRNRQRGDRPAQPGTGRERSRPDHAAEHRQGDHLDGFGCQLRSDHVHDRGQPGARHAVGHRCEPHLHACGRLSGPGLVHLPGQRRGVQLQPGHGEPPGREAVRRPRCRTVGSRRRPSVPNWAARSPGRTSDRTPTT